MSAPPELHSPQEILVWADQLVSHHQLRLREFDLFLRSLTVAPAEGAPSVTSSKLSLPPPSSLPSSSPPQTEVEGDEHSPNSPLSRTLAPPQAERTESYGDALSQRHTRARIEHVSASIPFPHPVGRPPSHRREATPPAHDPPPHQPEVAGSEGSAATRMRLPPASSASTALRSEIRQGSRRRTQSASSRTSSRRSSGERRRSRGEGSRSWRVTAPPTQEQVDQVMRLLPPSGRGSTPTTPQSSAAHNNNNNTAAERAGEREEVGNGRRDEITGAISTAIEAEAGASSGGGPFPSAESILLPPQTSTLGSVPSEERLYIKSQLWLERKTYRVWMKQLEQERQLAEACTFHPRVSDPPPSLAQRSRRLSSPSLVASTSPTIAHLAGGGVRKGRKKGSVGGAARASGVATPAHSTQCTPSQSGVAVRRQTFASDSCVRRLALETSTVSLYEERSRSALAQRAHRRPSVSLTATGAPSSALCVPPVTLSRLQGLACRDAAPHATPKESSGQSLRCRSAEPILSLRKPVMPPSRFQVPVTPQLAVS